MIVHCLTTILTDALKVWSIISFVSPINSDIDDLVVTLIALPCEKERDLL